MKHQEFVRAQKIICKTKNICKRQRKHHKNVTDCAYLSAAVHNLS